MEDINKCVYNGKLFKHEFGKNLYKLLRIKYYEHTCVEIKIKEGVVNIRDDVEMSKHTKGDIKNNYTIFLFPFYTSLDVKQFNITRLYIIEQHNIETIPYIKNLKYLKIYNCSNIKEIPYIEKLQALNLNFLPKLEFVYFSMTYTSVKFERCLFLDKLISFKSRGLYHCYFVPLSELKIKIEFNNAYVFNIIKPVIDKILLKNNAIGFSEIFFNLLKEYLLQSV